MASEPIECQVVVLRVSIHCEGCKKKVKKVLQSVHGVLRCDIDARSNKVVVTASKKLDPNILVAKLRKSGKQAEPWPEPPAESQSQETDKKQSDEPSKPAEKQDGPDNAEAAEPSNPQPSPEQNAGENPKPAQESSKEASNSDANAGDEAAAATEQQQPNEAKGKKEKQQQQPEPERHHPVDARVTMEYADRGVDSSQYNMMNRRMPIMSYNMARPSPSASYYAAPPPAPAPMPTARSAGPSYRSPYGYHYQQPAASTEDYYYSAPPQRSAFSPPRDGYGDMFNDENANSCAVM
ncbi:hypothetical protein PR202_ga08406 [Eleusine coracana subsp. coracana]|uniref:HMA domain-containing protein n=1 Tax=Eleusine coracana subsp. coracana TaxID=191504 RepID=A0AAV5C2N1_ELECO|nr:hypothetical protein PR202_ga08406 [Eleusine coracana subsp. coracana]